MKPIHVVLPALAVAGLATYDLLQKKHAILRTFPVLGHARYALEEIGPELRQYIVTNNNDERPFSRDQRTWVYASSKLENNYFGFGTDNNIEENAGYAIVKHRTFADVPPAEVRNDVALPSAKILGGPRGRRLAFRPDSLVNVSAMSYGSLSGAAIDALNRGAAKAGALHNTGEGGLSDHHRQGGDLVYQIGTGYFGCRDLDGHFSLDALRATIADAPVRALEIKLSQGAKPGLGGFLPAQSHPGDRPDPRDPRGGELRESQPPLRLHRRGLDARLRRDARRCDRPAGGHQVRRGRPVVLGGTGRRHERPSSWRRLHHHRWRRRRDGAAPLVFADSVAYWLANGSRRHTELRPAGIAEDVTSIASGKYGLTDKALVAFALGADIVNITRERCSPSAPSSPRGAAPTGARPGSPPRTRGWAAVSTRRAVRAAGELPQTFRRNLVRFSAASASCTPGW